MAKRLGLRVHVSHFALLGMVVVGAWKETQHSLPSATSALKLSHNLFHYLFHMSPTMHGCTPEQLWACVLQVKSFPYSLAGYEYNLLKQHIDLP